MKFNIELLMSAIAGGMCAAVVSAKDRRGFLKVITVSAGFSYFITPFAVDWLGLGSSGAIGAVGCLLGIGGYGLTSSLIMVSREFAPKVILKKLGISINDEGGQK